MSKNVRIIYNPDPNKYPELTGAETAFTINGMSFYVTNEYILLKDELPAPYATLAKIPGLEVSLTSDAPKVVENWQQNLLVKQKQQGGVGERPDSDVVIIRYEGLNVFYKSDLGGAWRPNSSKKVFWSKAKRLLKLPGFTLVN